jgi:5-formyltetrahydrofolate cyclo-ligase
MDSRQILRQQLREQRARLTLSKQTIASKKVTERIIQNERFQQSQHIGVYIAINNEINPKIIIKKIWQEKKRCYLPILQKQQLVFCTYEKNTHLKKNRFNIPEPSSLESTIEAWNLDIVLVPLLGFTTQGERLGMGGGLYDRTFSFLLESPRPTKPYLIGLAYEWQKIESFGISAWDVPLNAVFTEKKMYCTDNVSLD